MWRTYTVCKDAIYLSVATRAHGHGSKILPCNFRKCIRVLQTNGRQATYDPDAELRLEKMKLDHRRKMKELEIKRERVMKELEVGLERETPTYREYAKIDQELEHLKIANERDRERNTKLG